VKLEKHHILNMPNLHVVNALLSLKNKGHLREVFNWQWHYFFLTDTGIEYLKGYLHLPDDVVPATLKKAAGAPAGEHRDGGAFGERGTGEAGDENGDDNGREETDAVEGPLGGSAVAFAGGAGERAEVNIHHGARHHADPRGEHVIAE